MKRRKYGKEPGISLHRWVVKVFKGADEPVIHYLPTKDRALEKVQESFKCGASHAQIFKAIHEFEEAWESGLNEAGQ